MATTLSRMDDRLGLPDGFTARPLTPDDIAATIAMVNTCEMHDSGELMWERADLTSDSKTDGFNHARDWVGVFDGDRIVGWGMIVHRRGAWIDVHPDARGRGIGTWLRWWSIERAHQIGTDRIGQTIDDRRESVAAMFLAAGYTPRKTSWILRMDHSSRPADPEPPAGIAMRAFQPQDERQLLTMFEEAFSEFSDRLRSTLVTLAGEHGRTRRLRTRGPRGGAGR